jgi:hypothetical protein
MIMIIHSAILDLQITGRHGKASGYIFVTFHMNDEEFTAFIMKCQLLTQTLSKPAEEMLWHPEFLTENLFFTGKRTQCISITIVNAVCQRRKIFVLLHKVVCKIDLSEN